MSLKQWVIDLMLIPGLSGYEGRVRKYLKAAMAGLGITSTTDRLGNLIATLPGERTERILLASHFDTKPVTEFRFVGANDGGSSTGALLELARVLKTRPKPRFTLEFLFFDGEEAYGEWREPNHTYGSRHYVSAARAAGTLKSIRAMILLDFVADRKLSLPREGSSDEELWEQLREAAKSAGVGSYFPDETDVSIQDDHTPFLRQGVPSIDLIDWDFPCWHETCDDLSAVSQRSLDASGESVAALLRTLD